MQLVGTPKSKIQQLEKKLLGLPWQKMRDLVEVKLNEQGCELYMLAKSEGQQAEEMAMRRKRPARLLRKLRAINCYCGLAPQNQKPAVQSFPDALPHPDLE